MLNKNETKRLQNHFELEAMHLRELAELAKDNEEIKKIVERLTILNLNTYNMFC